MPRESEICEAVEADLNQQLGVINKLLFNLCLSNPLEIKNFKVGLKKVFKDKKGIYKFLEQQVLPSQLTEFATSKPQDIFPLLKKDKIQGKISPFFGDLAKPESPLYNKDLVIGLTYHSPDLEINYRLDYDLDKDLHINMTFLMDNTLYLFTLSKLTVKENMRFFVKAPEHDKYGKNISGEKKQIQLDMIKLKFFIKMTIHCFHAGLDLNKKSFFIKEVERLNMMPNLLNISDQNLRNELIDAMIKSYSSERKNNLLKHIDLPRNTEDSEKSDNEDSCASSKIG